MSCRPARQCCARPSAAAAARGHREPHRPAAAASSPAGTRRSRRRPRYRHLFADVLRALLLDEQPEYVLELLPESFAPLAAVPVGLGLACLGYSLWSERRVSSAQRVRVFGMEPAHERRACAAPTQRERRLPHTRFLRRADRGARGVPRQHPVRSEDWNRAEAFGRSPVLGLCKPPVHPRR